IDNHEDYLAAEEAVENHEIVEANLLHMEEALVGLGEPCKTILYDFYIKNRSMADICEKFGYTNTDNAKTQKYKCLQRLKKLFFKKKVIPDRHEEIKPAGIYRMGRRVSSGRTLR